MRWKIQTGMQTYTCDAFSVDETGALHLYGAYDETHDTGSSYLSIHSPASILARPITKDTRHA